MSAVLTSPAARPSLPATRPPETAFQDTPLGRRLRAVFLFAASLKLAVGLLSLFTICLIAATLIESSYSGKVARDLIYHTWWFTLLLCLLGLNILCAALKKFPWKRHQVGFLITHAGLIVLVLGGLLTNLGGVEGSMSLLDTDNDDIQQAFRIAGRSDTIQLTDRHQVEVYRVPRERARQDTKLLKDIVDMVNGGLEMGDSLEKRLEGHHWSWGLAPGSFAWHSDRYLKPEMPAALASLKFLADPAPGFSRRIDENTVLTVENYYPHTERWPFSDAPDREDEDTFPAMQIRLTTPMTPMPVKRWISSLPSLEPDPSPIAFEVLILNDPALLAEFLTPPSAAEIGKNGQLVIALGPERSILRVSLDKLKEGETIDVPGGLKFTLKRRGELMALLGRQEEMPPGHAAPSYPAVEFELATAKGKGNYICCARLPHLRAFRDGEDVVPTTAWYHHPDFKWGQAYRMGALQFLKGPGGKVYYRVYGKDGLKGPGRELDPNDPDAVVELPFKPMDMKLQVLTWFPEAVRREKVVPRNVRPGSDPAERLEPALRCTMECNGEKEEFWVRLSRGATQVNVGKEIFFVRYRNDTRRLDFDLTLKAARQVSDPGTNRPASFESDVVLGRKDGEQRQTSEHTISMNHTLDHGGFKVYQTNYRPMTHPQTGDLLLDEQGKLVSLSGFTVADDPGLWCKYLGSALLVLGIATMFWMRAYFFKRPSAARLSLSKGFGMTQQTTRHHATPLMLNENPDTLRLTGPRRPRQSRGFWTLLIIGGALNFAIFASGVPLLLSARKSVAPPAERRIEVPFADDAELWKPIHAWVVQEDGRNKPFETFCRESVRTITGRERFENNDAVAVVASWLLLNDPDENRAFRNAQKANCYWEEYPFVLCDHHELRELLFRDKRGEDAELTAEELHGKYVTPKLVRDSAAFKKVMRDVAAKQAEDSKAALSSLEVKASELKKRLALYDRIRGGGQEGRERVHAPGELGLVALDRHGSTWFSLRSLREYQKTPAMWEEVMNARRIVSPRDYEGAPAQKFPAAEVKQIADAADAMQSAYLAGESEAFTTAAEKFNSTITDVSQRFSDYPGTETTAMELWFNQANPFRKAWITSLLTTALLLASVVLGARWPVVGRSFYFAGLLAYMAALAWSAAGFYCRVSISGRPPVSNMYESVIWVGFMTAVFGLLLELFHRKGVLALAGALVSTFSLVLADQLPLTLNPNIQPLQAVLRSNYWLVIHVLTIVSSYAAFALAWGLGNFNLGLMLFAPWRRDLIKSMSQLSYRAIQVGVVLIAAGTLLGGFWAAESWGRFWGWDPKEVWALIALLCYVIPLHARYVGWVKDFGLAACSVVCFASVVMAWYGVNFVLGAGLHSYGFGGGNDAWVYWGGLVNISLVIHAALRYYYWQPAAEENV